MVLVCKLELQLKLEFSEHITEHKYKAVWCIVQSWQKGAYTVCTQNNGKALQKIICRVKLLPYATAIFCQKTNTVKYEAWEGTVFLTQTHRNYKQCWWKATHLVYL